MDRAPLAIGILVILGIIAALAYERPMPPSERLADAVALAKERCALACAGTPAEFTLRLPDGAAMYTAEDAVCARLDSKLFCGTCPCALERLQLNLSPERDYRCSFAGAENITLSCS